MRVSLMITCLCETLYPNVGMAAVRVLNRLGVGVDFPEGQSCCGQPAFNSGYRAEALKAARAAVAAFEEASHVVSVSGSCAGMIRHNYPNLFRGEPDEAAALALAAKTYEFSEFLVEVLGVHSLPVSFEGRAVFHNSCHTRRWLGVTEPPRKLLGMVRGLEVVELPSAHDCCGFGGTFSVKMPEISARMVEEKAAQVRAAGAGLIVSLDMSCLMNIMGRLHREGAGVAALHVAEFLDANWEESRDAVKAA